MVASACGHHRARWMIPILLLAFLLRMAYLDAQSMWYDEAFSAMVSNVDLPSLPDWMLDIRVHPPFYFVILHFWLGLGHGEFVLRSFSAFAGVLTVASMYPLGTLIGAKRLGTISAFALAISPFHIWYSQEVKMYSLIALLTLMSNYFLLRLLREDRVRNWLGYVVLTSLAVYTHYLALFVVVAQMTWLTLLRRRCGGILRKWVLCAVLIGLLYAPWVVAVLVRGGFSDLAIAWIPAAQPTDLFWTVYDFGFGSTSDPSQALNLIPALLLVGILTYVSLQMRSGRTGVEERNQLALVWLWLFLPLAFVFLISLDWPLPQKRSIYMDRYLTLLLPAFILLVCYGISRIFRSRKALGVLIAVALLVPVGVSTTSIFVDQRYHRDQWRQAIVEIRQNARSGDILLVRPAHRVVLYYYDVQDIPWFTVPYLGSQREYDAFLASEVPIRLSEGGRIWTLIVSGNVNAHRFVQGAQNRLLRRVAEDEVRSWLLQHYRLLEESTYNGIYLASYG